MPDKYTVFVCSSDKFSDCWEAFFSLFKRYWPGFNGEIILATETMSYAHDGLNIICPCVQKNVKKQLSWSEVIFHSLNTIKTTHFLLFLEDYFIRSAVNETRLEELFQLMIKEDFDHLMLIPMPGNNLPTPWDFLLERAPDAPYRISTQCGFWKKKVFLNYLRSHETPWQFELWGTKRAWKQKDRFYSISINDVEKNSYIIDYYIRGAITKGKWQKSVPEFLKTNDIANINYNIRGFFDPDFIAPIGYRLKKRLFSLPGEFKSWLSTVS